MSVALFREISEIKAERDAMAERVQELEGLLTVAYFYVTNNDLKSEIEATLPEGGDL